MKKAERDALVKERSLIGYKIIGGTATQEEIERARAISKVLDSQVLSKVK